MSGFSSPLNFQIRSVAEGYIVDNIFIGTSGTSPTVTYVGDSLTAGSGGTHPYDFYITLPTYNGQTLTATNVGVGGRTISGMADFANRNLTPLYNYKSGLNIALVWGGINDLYGGASAAQTYSYIEAFCDHLRGLGFKVIVGTLTSAVTVDSARQTVNTYIRNNWTRFADAIADFAGNANIGGNGAYANATYFNVDQIHLKDAGYAIVGGIAQTAIERVADTSPNYIAANVPTGSAISLTTTVAANVPSIALPPGDWDVEADLYFNVAGSTVLTSIQGAISLTANTLSTTEGWFQNAPMFVQTGSTIGVTPSLHIGPVRIPSTAVAGLGVALVAKATFTTSTVAAWGVIRAARVSP